ncbi:MAG: AAA family ATPase [Lachnospiraceae bacterium]|nr:AAA family ATPase [Lachnospiraceae bacterium]
MGSINDIYSDFFGSLDELQKENNKRLEELNQMLHGENGILNDGLPGSLPGAGNISGGTVMGGDHSFTTGAEGSVWNSEGGEIAGKILSGSGRPAGAGPVSEEDALQHAQDALSDAKSLFGKPPVAKAAGDPAKATEVPPKKEEQDPEEQLDELIGLKDIKKDVRELADFAKVQKMRKDQGMKSVPVSLHLVFTGNPGTGKTTVARILGKLYNKIGILSKGQLVEVDRSGLVAGYLGQTAIKVQEVIQSAIGGVLFIDEAYSLAQENDSFGQEAIDTLLKAMEDHRDDLIVIVAGYTEPMRHFIDSNPGLKSRFNKYIEFPDYTVDELEQIFYLNCKKYDYVVDYRAKEKIREMITQRRMEKLINFANAREVRNMFEMIITNQASRVARMENPKPGDLKKITVADLTETDYAEEDEKKGKAKNGAAKENAAETSKDSGKEETKKNG